MGWIKRLNLSFDLRRDDDREVYQILKNKRYKTDYVVKSILAFENDTNIKTMDINTIKNALKDVLNETNIGVQDRIQNGTHQKGTDIPNEVYDIFEKL